MGNPHFSGMIFETLQMITLLYCKNNNLSRTFIKKCDLNVVYV